VTPTTRFSIENVERRSLLQPLLTQPFPVKVSAKVEPKPEDGTLFKWNTISKSLPLAAAVALTIGGYSTTLFAADAKLPDDIKSSGKLVLGTSASVGLPWSSTKEGTTDQFIGFDHDLAEAIATKLGLKLEVSNMGFDSLIPSLQAGRVNIVISGMFDSLPREQKVDFVDHAVGGSAMLVKAGGTDDIKSRDDLCGHTASALRGAVEGTTAEEISKNCVAAGKAAVEVQTFPDTQSQFAALSSGRSDAALGDLEGMGLLAASQPDKFKLVGDAFNSGPVGIAVPKGSPLGAVVVETLDSLIADGTYDKLFKQYQLPEMARVTKAVLNGASAAK
jgi:polar amino acid transport system substrate-binding protein